MDKALLSEIVNLMDGSTFKIVTRDATIPGFRKGKAPQAVVARTIGSSTERSQLLFLHKVFSAYFPDIDVEAIQLTELQVTEENWPGIMAAYALRGMENECPVLSDTDSISKEQGQLPMQKTYPGKDDGMIDRTQYDMNVGKSDTQEDLFEGPNPVAISAEKETINSDEMDRPQDTESGNDLLVLKDCKGESIMRYIGFIEVQDSMYGPFYNFFPVARVKDDGSFERIERYEREDLFPRLGNLNIRAKMRDDAPIADLFKNGALYVIDIEENQLEENRTVRDGTLKKTVYRVDFATLQERNAILLPEEIGIYRVIDIPDIQIKLENDEMIQLPFQDQQESFRGPVMLRDGDVLVGPLPVRSSGDGAYFIVPQSKICNYVFPVYNLELVEEDMISNDDIGSAEMPSYIYVNTKGKDPRRIDFINDATLLSEFIESIEKDSTLSSLMKRTVDDKEDDADTMQSYERIVSSAFAALQIPEDIIIARTTRLVELFVRLGKFDDAVGKVSDAINSLLVAAAKDDDPRFEGTFSALKNREGFMQNIQRLRIVDEEIEIRKADLGRIKQEIAEQEARLKETKQTIEFERSKVLNEDIEKAQKEIEEKREELAQLTEELMIAQSIDALKGEKYFYERSIDEKKKELERITTQTREITKEFETQLENTNAVVGRLVIEEKVATRIAASSRLSAVNEYSTQEEVLRRIVEFNTRLIGNNDVSQDALIEVLCQRIHQYRPNYDRNDIVNILLCLTQGFITVFSGAPGTGKTSICKVVAHALGLDSISSRYGNQDDNPWGKDCERSNRYAFISVERGWSSKRDFIGYYNPLTRGFDKNNKKVFDALEITSAEHSKRVDNSVPPYIIVLDEANLSPMEYYWADFMAASDQQSEPYIIEVGDGISFSISNNLRFLATINNDHTTESLSPRLVDRAWIVSLPQPKNPSMIDFAETYAPVPMGMLKETFDPTIKQQGVFNAVYQGTLLKIFAFCREKLGIVISPRTELAIQKYCSVGCKLFVSDDFDAGTIATDYAVLQRILPKVQGYGAEYKTRLEEMIKLLNQNNLMKSSETLSRIIRNGDMNMQYYQFFA